MMMASTRTLIARETTLPSTFSARKAVRPNRPKGTRTKPARVVSLNSIRRDEELDRHHEEAHDDDEPGDKGSRSARSSEKAGEAHHAGDGVEDRLAGIDADLGKMTGLEQLRLAVRVPPPASRPSPAKELNTTWARLLKFPMMKANSAYI